MADLGFNQIINLQFNYTMCSGLSRWDYMAEFRCHLISYEVANDENTIQDYHIQTSLDMVLNVSSTEGRFQAL